MLRLQCSLLTAVLGTTIFAFDSAGQFPLSLPSILPQRNFGHNELFIPTVNKPLPGKAPFLFDEEKFFYEKYINGSKGGTIRRSSCPAINTLANRGFIERDGRNISWNSIAQAARDVWNFGDDNIMVVLGPVFAAHAWPETIDLDMMADDKVQHIINCPAAPTRNDREIGDNVNLNITLFESLLTFSKDGETLSVEDMAEHHHLRHNQSSKENSFFRFGNRDADCTLAQYGNILGVLGRPGSKGLYTVFLEDLRTFYVEEDIPDNYARRELPFYFPEANGFIDRMAHHIGFQIERPWPERDQDGRDVEPSVARYDIVHP